MRILVATDAWPPQVNGVVRTLQSLAANVRKLGAEIEFMTPEGFRTFPLPTDRNVRCAIPTWREIARRIELAAPDGLHIATEGPIGHFVRRYCLVRKIPFTTSNMTRFPEYVSVRLRIPLSWTYAALRCFHAGAAVTMVSTRSLMEELGNRGFAHLAMWTRGVDTDLFRPDRAIASELPRPIFVSVGRIAIEKNLPAFLALDLPGSKVIIGDGPQAGELQSHFPEAHFLVSLKGKRLQRISPRRTCSCFRAAPIRLASFSLRHWPAAYRWQPIPFRDHRMLSAAIRSACSTRISNPPASEL
jgi:glycosyltransferase involved in cell wall biosynthesis